MNYIDFESFTVAGSDPKAEMVLEGDGETLSLDMRDFESGESYATGWMTKEQVRKLAHDLNEWLGSES